MRILKRLLIFLVILIAAAVLTIGIYLFNSRPEYRGEVKIKGLKEAVDVHFDGYGIPHIDAKSEEDAWFALGYVHAQDRLFQMEILRRIGAGRLAEILGSDLTRVDVFFRTLGIAEAAKKSAKIFMNDNNETYQKAANAYLNGINAYIETGKTPIEFTLIGIEKEKFTSEDLYHITGYMAFSFAEALKTDPILSKINSKYGTGYLSRLIKVNDSLKTNADSTSLSELALLASMLSEKFPLSPFMGSNGWVVAPQKSKSGRVLFCNDTHIGYGQPSVWYEAHVSYPGYSLYGNFLGGFPFPLLGHTNTYAWGLTMLENDDLDLFREKQNPQNPEQYFLNDHYENYALRKEVVKIKDHPDTSFMVRITRHGPVINEAIESIGKNEQQPVSLWWTFTQFDGTTLQACYLLSHAKSMGDMRNACSLIEAPGLNVLYGDASGNIAWWASGKMVKRKPHVNPNIILDGVSGNDEPSGFFSFSENPHIENPSCGYVFSANNLPDSISKNIYPGYYAPEERSIRIEKLLGKKNLFDADDMQRMNTDVVNENYKDLASLLYSIIEKDSIVSISELHKLAAEQLKDWDGNHRLKEIGPAVYYKLVSVILDMSMKDEMDSTDYWIFKSSHTMKSALRNFIADANSPWWDNIKTEKRNETRLDIISTAFDITIEELSKELGPVAANWKWERIHTVEHVHLIGRQKPFDRIFNVGPLPAPGGNETVNCSGFPLTPNGHYKVSYGPAMRVVIDFDDVENAKSILPTGQSGNFMSKHYRDQAQMYLDGKSRKMMMNKNEISKLKNKLALIPR